MSELLIDRILMRYFLLFQISVLSRTGLCWSDSNPSNGGAGRAKHFYVITMETHRWEELRSMFRPKKKKEEKIENDDDKRRK
jgi:hypothetical protein